MTELQIPAHCEITVVTQHEGHWLICLRRGVMANRQYDRPEDPPVFSPTESMMLWKGKEYILPSGRMFALRFGVPGVLVRTYPPNYDGPGTLAFHSMHGTSCEITTKDYQLFETPITVQNDNHVVCTASQAKTVLPLLLGSRGADLRARAGEVVIVRRANMVPKRFKIAKSSVRCLCLSSDGLTVACATKRNVTIVDLN